MSMLAGPRRKQKVINLRAKNNAWSNDSDKFGQRMLEKMGWSSGKGLGAKENGIVEHVVARYKNDERGLGFEDRNDQWTKHEDDFNALLANLSNGTDCENQTHSGISLEVKSKKSKARIHYHKFTRGKDIARYSEKDLANIFGKKSLKKEEKERDTKLKDVKATEQVFTEKGSMEVYFKNKLAAIKYKKNFPCLSNANNTQDDADDYGDAGFKGFCNDDENPAKDSSQSFEFQSHSFYKSKEEAVLEKDYGITNQGNKSTKKRKKTKKPNSEEDNFENNIKNLAEENILNSHELNESDNEQQREKVKKTKKKKSSSKISIEELPKNKKNNVDEDSEAIQENVEEDIHVPKKKKKRKNKPVEN